MKHFLNPTKTFLLSLAIFLVIPSAQVYADAECAPGRTTLESQEITIPAELDCFEIELFDYPCPNTVRATFTNNCDAKITLEKDDGFNVEIEPTKDRTDWVYIDNGISETISYTATKEAKEFEIEIDVTINVSSDSDSSCSSIDHGKLSFYFLIGFALVVVRRKPKHN